MKSVSNTIEKRFSYKIQHSVNDKRNNITKEKKKENDSNKKKMTCKKLFKCFYLLEGRNLSMK